MRLVPVKTMDRQAAFTLVGLRDRRVRNRARLANAIGAMRRCTVQLRQTGLFA
jgi:hypothetical protein